ncbi:MAG: type IV pilus secretin PilQ [Desulfobacterales bacterium]
MTIDLKLRKRVLIGLMFAWLVSIVMGCASTSPKKTPEQSEKQTGPKHITRINTAEDRDSLNVLISGTGALTYTAIKQPHPLSVILYFPDTILENIKPLYAIDNDLIAAIKTSQFKTRKDVSKIEIVLKKDIPYEVVPKNSGLKVTFQKPAALALLEPVASTPPKQQEAVAVSSDTTDASAETAQNQADLQEAQESPQEKQESAAPIHLTEPEPSEATNLDSVVVNRVADGIEILVKADRSIKNYQAFAVENPARIVFDIQNMKSPFRKEQLIRVDTPWVKRVRHYGYPDKLRLVMETDSKYFSSFTSKSLENSLLIYVGQKAAPAQDASAGTPETEPKELQPAHEAGTAGDFGIIRASLLHVRSKPDRKSASLALLSEGSKVKILERVDGWLRIEHGDISGFVRNKSRYVRIVTGAGGQHPAGGSAWVNRIDFISEDKGRSTIVIGTTQPVNYTTQKLPANKLHLKLFGTRIPNFRKRPLITTRFDSAVDRITPIQTPSMKNEALVAIELREQVPYLVEQQENLILIHFEASSISPRPFEQADLVALKEVVSQTIPKITAAEKKDQKPTVAKKYTGEKIALDFFETEIKNVFRILKEVSGKNFAIDTDVKGKVTMTLENPVPWDQVLELILKMNQLGKIVEGDIIRITTLETLAKEDVRQRAELKAAQETQEQKTAFEPLLTEYISVNYSNAKDEILPHLEKIKSKERGRLSVDGRTNMIIMTDVAQKIKQAREIVKQLDKVTPQVIIEARIVEASTNLSREMGVQWGALYGNYPSSNLNTDVYGKYVDVGDTTYNIPSVTSPVQNLASSSSTPGTNVEMNLPIASTSMGAIGFSFAQVAGVPLLLNAKLLALESQGELKIISAPKIVTIDNKKAIMEQGLLFPYNKLDGSGNTVTEFLDIKLILEVTPHVTADSRISMKIKIIKNDLGTISATGVPEILTKEAETELLVNDGDTVIIGGIIKTRQSKSYTGIPYLSKIPLLGALFRSRAKAEVKEELLIFITPKAVQLKQR